MKGKYFVLVAVLLISLLFFGCDSGTGNVTLNLTDAPVDDLSIKEVNITVNGIGYQVGEDEDGEWVNIDFEEPETYNLLDLTGGESEMLGQFLLPAGKINQLRFFLDAPETGGGTPSNPGCYLLLEGETDAAEDDIAEALFVPSGGSSGFKATGSFIVPINGSVEITADFDARKSVWQTGSGANPSYKLQPTIRLIVDAVAGGIEGTVIYTGENVPVVFAYEDETFNDSELLPDDEEPAFPNAVSSFGIADPDPEDETEELSYILAYLAEGVYDLVFIEQDSDGNYIAESVKLLENVTVTGGETVEQDFDYTAVIE